MVRGGLVVRGEGGEMREEVGVVGGGVNRRGEGMRGSGVREEEARGDKSKSLLDGRLE